MGWLSEHILYWLARGLYKTQLAHSREMKEALSSPEKNTSYRAAQISRVVAAARRYGVQFGDKVVLDLGCSNGALTVQYLSTGARRVIGVDVDANAVAAARAQHAGPSVEFHVSEATRLPLPDESIDTIISYDVFEHISHPAEILAECKRVLRSGGKMLIGTWGWYHPFAPHLWATMPVPWAHVFFSEATVLRTCRRVFHARWYVPTMHDLDEHGRKKEDKYSEEAIPTNYLNKYLICDFERIFRGSGLQWRIHLEPFGSRYARWSRVFLRLPYLREFFHAYLWAVLQKQAEPLTGPDRHGHSGCAKE